jgi:hypothetical protein
MAQSASSGRSAGPRQDRPDIQFVTIAFWRSRLSQVGSSVKVKLAALAIDAVHLP